MRLFTPFIFSHADGGRMGSTFIAIYRFFQSLFSKYDAARITKLNVKMFSMSRENSRMLVSKGQRSRSQCLCRCLDRTEYCRCCCVRKLRWVFPDVIPRRICNASDISFHASLPHVRWTLGFSRCDFLHSCEC